MPNLSSPDWNEESGVCVKHGIPMTPCPKCLAEKDPNVEVFLTREDVAMLDCDPDMTPEGLFPVEEEWLAERIVGQADH